MSDLWGAPPPFPHPTPTPGVAYFALAMPGGDADLLRICSRAEHELWAHSGRRCAVVLADRAVLSLDAFGVAVAARVLTVAPGHYIAVDGQPVADVYQTDLQVGSLGHVPGGGADEWWWKPLYDAPRLLSAATRDAAFDQHQRVVDLVRQLGGTLGDPQVFRTRRFAVAVWPTSTPLLHPPACILAAAPAPAPAPAKTTTPRPTDG